MRRRSGLINLLSTSLAIAMTLVMLVGLFVTEGSIAVVISVLLQVVVVTTALAIMIGVLNLLWVHLRRMLGRQRGAFYSLILILSFAGVLVVRALDVRTTDDQAVSTTLFSVIQVSMASALAGLIFFFLVYAAYRLLHRQITLNGCLFTGAVLLVLVGWLPFSGLEVVSNLRDWFLEVPVQAGSRGLLIGIALATITAGLRVLVGQERAFREDNL